LQEYSCKYIFWRYFVKKLLMPLTVLALAGLLSGCGPKQAASTAGTSGFQFTGYPMNARNVTIRWAELGGIQLNSRIASAAESPFHTWYSELTGVNIEWIFPTSGSDAAQTYALIIAGGDLPDVINYAGLQNEAERLIEEGTIRDLTPHIEEWSPNYYKLLKADPLRDKSQKTDSGKYYRYGFFREEGPFMDTWVGPMVRKDWLDANNLPMPQTIADWDRTLQVFKDRYGAVLSFEKGFGSYGGLAGAFGAYAMYNFQWFVDENGKIQAANIQSEYRNYLAKLNEWWAKGLLDPDSMTIDQATFRSKALDNKIGISYGALSRVTNLVNDAAAANTGAEWIGLGYPKGNDGTLTMVQGNWGVGSDAGVVTTGCPPEKFEIAMRLWDYGYSEEGFLFQNYGKKGDSWDYDAAGKIVFTPKILNDPDAIDLPTMITRYVGQRGSMPGLQATHLPELINAPISFASATTWFYPNEEVAYKHMLPPGMTLTLEETDRYSELMNPINTYTSEMAVSFVTGQTSLSEFNSFVSRLNQMGLAEAQRIQQAALDRWNAR
jgi:putative aldouronate transport system substrate-binding protein